MTTCGPDLKSMSMRELLRMEVTAATRVMIDTLLELEQGNLTDKQLESIMRAAHSVRGGARIAELPPVVELAHVMEDLFVAVRAGEVPLQKNRAGLLLEAIDLLTELTQAGVIHDILSGEMAQRASAMRDQILLIAQSPSCPKESGNEPETSPDASMNERRAQPALTQRPGKVPDAQAAAGRTVRVSVESMNQLMAVTDDLHVMNKTATGVRAETIQARQSLREILEALDGLKRKIVDFDPDELQISELEAMAERIRHVDTFLTRTSSTLKTHEGHSAEIMHLMQSGVIAHRMQPFGDVAQSLRRLVWELSQALGKQVTLEVSGADTGVDSDILERLKTPLIHLIQNAVDHGILKAEERLAAGKPAEGSIHLSAQLRDGMLSVVVEDDGQGIDLEQVRQIVSSNRLVNERVAASLQEQELLEFLFLPNFTTSHHSSEASGRGIGLDLVRHTLQEVRGSVQISTQAGKGTRFEITLPATLIVVRCLVVEIAGELFALPLGRTSGSLQTTYAAVQTFENRQHLLLDGHKAGLVVAAEILGLSGGKQRRDELSVVILTKDQQRYGLVVDRLVAERQMVERPLDARLAKAEHITSMSVLDDGTPVMILDVDELLHSIERSSRKVGEDPENDLTERGKRVLVVDDSITVREVECGLLRKQGYQVDVAVDGAEGWDTLRTGKYDLVVTDMDMPRMNGVELVALIRADAQLRELPVIIVSYKNRDENQLNGSEAGADRYLNKGHFKDDTFVDTVFDLIGGALS